MDKAEGEVQLYNPGKLPGYDLNNDFENASPDPTFVVKN